MIRKLENRNALITGASRGIGKAIATCFAQEGANLFLCARNLTLLEKTKAELQLFGVKLISYRVDISDFGAVKEMVHHALGEFSQIDILVNNAGIYKASRFLDYTPNDLDLIMRVNFFGVFYVTQAILSTMINHKKGKIINIASTAGKCGSRNQSIYNSSKHALVGLTRSLALELAPYGINVNAICPILVETSMGETFLKQQSSILGISEENIYNYFKPLIPLGRFIKPIEVAKLALYLASEESDNMTGQSVALCGGYTMF